MLDFHPVLAWRRLYITPTVCLGNISLKEGMLEFMDIPIVCSTENFKKYDIFLGMYTFCIFDKVCGVLFLLYACKVPF